MSVVINVSALWVLWSVRHETFGISAISGVLMSVTFNNGQNRAFPVSCTTCFSVTRFSTLPWGMSTFDRWWKQLGRFNNLHFFFNHAHLQKKTKKMEYSRQPCGFTISFGTNCFPLPKHLQWLNQTCKKQGELCRVLFLHLLEVWWNMKQGCMVAQWTLIFTGDWSAWWCDVPKVPNLRKSLYYSSRNVFRRHFHLQQMENFDIVKCIMHSFGQKISVNCL